MSLRDALLQAGAIDKKKKKQVERDLKNKRKKKQGDRERASVIRRREKAEAKARAQEARERRTTERKRREDAAAVAAAHLRTRHLVAAHGVHTKGRNGTRFYFPMLDGVTVGRLWVPWTVARSLRSGQHAVAGLVHPYDDEVEYLVIPRDIALTIRASLANTVVFFNETAGDEPFTDDL